MTDQISHTEAHEKWSEKQLSLFKAMKPRERLNAVKSGALEHWTKAARDAALDLFGHDESRASISYTPQTLRFEPALYSLPRQATYSSRLDPTLFAAVLGWVVIIIATAGQAYGLY